MSYLNTLTAEVAVAKQKCTLAAQRAANALSVLSSSGLPNHFGQGGYYSFRHPNVPNDDLAGATAPALRPCAGKGGATFFLTTLVVEGAGPAFHIDLVVVPDEHDAVVGFEDSNESEFRVFKNGQTNPPDMTKFCEALFNRIQYALKLDPLLATEERVSIGAKTEGF